MITVLCAQIELPSGEGPDDRLARIRGSLLAADLVVLPELWDVGYFAFDEYAAAARPIEAAVEGPARLARELGAVVVAGSVLERDGDALHNTIPVLGQDGALLGTYRKSHLFGYGSREAELLTPGDGPVVVETPVGRLGLATCFDLRFPEHFAALRAGGADVHVVPAAWPAARASHWDVLTRARAIETQTPLVACNGAGDEHGVRLAGRSVICDALGDVVASAGEGAETVEAKLDHGATAAWRADFRLS